MSNENQETIANIVAEMLRDCPAMHMDGTRYLDGDWVYTKGSVERLAARIKIANKREITAKDTEIAELHNMIEELTDALHPFREWFGNQKLIDRAKKMIGLKEIGDMT